ISFKDGFDPEGGISVSSKKELFELLDSVKEENKECQIKTYATGIFRNLINETRVSFIDECFTRTGLFFNIISQDLENFYLEMALVGKCLFNEPILLINIGGDSTELVVVYGKEAVERKNINLGVGMVITRFPSINEKISKVSLQEVVNFVKENIPDLSNKVKIAFYTGGELNYMQLANYPLKSNKLFIDNDHPFLISADDFSKRNEDIFEKVSLKELESFMPNDPKWMHGARGCSAIAQAICEKYQIKTIIPSNSNLINGVVRQEFRYVTISGSFRKHLDYILDIKGTLEDQGTKVLSPRFTEPKNPGEKFVVFTGEEGLSPLELERHHLSSISKSDALIVCDPEGYVGASALIEIGFANAIGKKVVFVEKPEEFMLNTLPAEIGL
ncbi:MAG TPA: hypothetical protein PKZ10_02700, partial [Candidatus Pacearchaeota archaeon]|nr:hypothetical protein [Candidatus Pacearchaeota archaeon]